MHDTVALEYNNLISFFVHTFNDTLEMILDLHNHWKNSHKPMNRDQKHTT